MILYAVLFVALLLAAVYGMALTWEFVSKYAKRNVAHTVASFLAAFVVLSLVMPSGGAYAQSASISLDMTPFFTSLNSYLPTFVQIFGLIGGIAAALGFARFIIGTIVRSLSGGGGFG